MDVCNIDENKTLAPLSAFSANHKSTNLGFVTMNSRSGGSDWSVSCPLPPKKILSYTSLPI